MIKRITVLLVCLIFALTPVYAEDSAFTGSVKGGENVELTVTASSTVNVRAFVYTYSVSGAGHCLLDTVETTDIAAGESKTLTITPPAEGYTKKLVLTERFTLTPLCRSYVYPYMVNLYAEPLGYRLLDVGTITDGSTTYASNEYEIIEFMQGEEEEEVSTLSLAMAAFGR